MLNAYVSDATLIVGGSASDPFELVSVYQQIHWSPEIGYSYVFDVEDSDRPATPVPVFGDQSNIQIVNVSGVEGAGVSINTYAPNISVLIGSGGDDHMTNIGDNNIRIWGGFGDDGIFSWEGDDILWGEEGDDRLGSGVGNDRISGGSGNDEIRGGTGSDTLIMTGAQSEYTIEIVDGQYVISHLDGLGYDGTDVFTNIEKLRFSDEIVFLDRPSTDLTATVTGSTLEISGTAATSDGDVRILNYGTEITIEDNNTLATEVYIDGDLSAMQHIDASGVIGVGVLIVWADYDTQSVITGSRYDDYIETLSWSDDSLRGRRGHDELVGDDSDNHFIGGLGNDRIDGGHGFDTAFFAGQMSEFTIQKTLGGYRVSHTGGTGASGSDVLTGIEQLSFTDQTVLIDDLVFV